MSVAIETYQHWLGIAPGERPLNHYALLGLEAHEADRDRIWELAERQMGRILAVDPSLQNAEARRVFEELEAARDCLCHPQKKQAYDATLPPRPIPDSQSTPQPAAVAEEPVSPEAATLLAPPTTRPAPEVPAPQEPPAPFDPYRDWLGISDPQRPPNHYVLLGLKLFEDDRQRIDDVSMLLMAQALEHDPGPHAEEARRLFDDLEVARDCLSDSQKKQAYDASLREPPAAQSPTAKRPPEKPAGAGPMGSDSTPGRKKSWGNLAPRRPTLQPVESFEHRGATAVAEESDSAIRRHAQTPQPPEPTEIKSETFLTQDVRQSRLVGAILGIVCLTAAIAWFLLREPPERNPVPGLVANLSHTDPQRRIEAAQALRKLGPRSSDALPQMVQSLGHESNENVRLALAQAVREAGPGALLYSREFEVIKLQEQNPGVLQILNELTAR